MSYRQKAFLAIFLGSLFTGAVAAVTKIGLTEIPPLSFAFLRFYVIKLGGSVFASMGFYLTPVFAFLAAFVLLGEKLTSGFLFGGTLALLGIYLTTRK